MRRLRRHRGTLSGFALLAALAFALLPTLARAAAAGSGADPWGQICSAGGSLRLAEDDAGSSSPAGVPAAQGLVDHCPLCSGAHLAHALPPRSSGGLPAAPAAATPLPACAEAPPRCRRASRPPPSRGPPRFS